MTKPTLPQGTRDFSAQTIYKRNFILNSIKETFLLYGFEPLETPALENLETLMGKYGDEGDKLIFKILNNGLNDAKNIEKAQKGFDELMKGKASVALTERALKYDLTIPFARYVAMNHGQLTFPYKRFQIQQVWRADRPQRGRYREFTQCDADIAGSKSLWNEVEFANIYHTAFTKMGLKDYKLKVNNRKILAGLAEKCGGENLLGKITVAIDKIDKVGLDKILEELKEKDFRQHQLDIVKSYLSIKGSNNEVLANGLAFFKGIAVAEEGLSELAFVTEKCTNVNISIDLSLARGLNYYTGIIFEAAAPDTVKMGSIGGGGRYDDLTGLFGVSGIAGVGISFGVDRIYDVLEELNIFPEGILATSKALFFNMGNEEAAHAFTLMQHVRQAQIACELYHETVKMDKQFKYAQKKGILFAIIIGSKEVNEKSCVVKDLMNGTQETINETELTEYLRTH